MPILLLVLWLPAAALARPLVPEDAAAIYDFIRNDIDVARDGTYTQIVEWQLELLRDNARGEYGTRKLFYREDVDRLEILEAATLNGTDRVSVPTHHREDKPVASNRPGFDAYRQVLLSYPDVRVGSKLYLKFRLSHKKPPLDGYFSRQLTLSGVEPRRSQTVLLRSELPLSLEPRDPAGKLAVTVGTEGERQTVRIEAKSLITEGVIDEERPVVRDADRTGVFVSSSTEFAPFNALAVAYEEALVAPLPPLFQSIVDVASKEREIVDKMDVVTSRLADVVRYMGDWRSVAGRFVPRGHAKVAETGFGDCKDYSTATAAMFRRLGFDARVALVERAVDPEPLPKLPHLGHFNHAIVHVTAAGGRDWWIDPTSDKSFARGIPEDIQGRSALVLRVGGPRLESIPWGAPKDSVSDTSVSIAFQDDGSQKILWKKRLTGQWAWEWTGFERSSPRKSVERRLQRYLVAPWELKEIRFEPFELTSRIVRELTLAATARVEMTLASTSAGKGYNLPDDDTLSAVRAIDGATRFSRFSLGPPGVMDRTLAVSRVSPVGLYLPKCSVSFPGLAASRTTTRTRDGFRVVDKVETTSRYLEAEALRSAPFRAFQNELRNCFARAVIVVQKPG